MGGPPHEPIHKAPGRSVLGHGVETLGPVWWETGGSSFPLRNNSHKHCYLRCSLHYISLEDRAPWSFLSHQRWKDWKSFFTAWMENCPHVSLPGKGKQKWAQLGHTCPECEVGYGEAKNALENSHVCSTTDHNPNRTVAGYVEAEECILPDSCFSTVCLLLREVNSPESPRKIQRSFQEIWDQVYLWLVKNSKDFCVLIGRHASW